MKTRVSVSQCENATACTINTTITYCNKGLKELM
jgi:hypothetical protein